MQPEEPELRRSELRLPRLPLTFDRLRLFVLGLITGPTKLPRHATYTLLTQVETDHPHIKEYEDNSSIWFSYEKERLIIADFSSGGKFFLPPGLLHPAAEVPLQILFLDRLALVVEFLART